MRKEKSCLLEDRSRLARGMIIEHPPPLHTLNKIDWGLAYLLSWDQGMCYLGFVLSRLLLEDVELLKTLFSPW